MTDYRPIDCDRHDYLEIACTYGYRLLIELTDGSRFEANAVTTRTAASKEEFLLLRESSGPAEVRLDALLAMTPLDAAARFERMLLTTG